MVAIVIDDEILAVEHIERLLRKADISVFGFTNPVEALESQQVRNADVAFLDIEMPVISGLRLAERIQEINGDCEVVFITGHNQYAVEAFEVNALDYLLKPVTTGQVDRAIKRIIKRRGKREELSAGKESTRNTIRITLFGKMSVSMGEVKKSLRFMTVKGAEIFCFMLLQKESEVSKWKLIDEIWPNKDLDKGDINLRSTVSRLNKTFRENGIQIAMKSTRNGYRLEILEEVVVDAFLLERIADEKYIITEDNIKFYEAVLLDYNDMLFEEFDSEWCNIYRTVYNRYFRIAVRRLVTYYKEVQPDPLIILNVIERIIKYEPYDENIRELSLDLIYKLAGKNGVREYYQDFTKLLKNDLGMKPGDKLDRYYNSIMKNS
jgi:two-component SAPR family response regulator